MEDECLKTDKKENTGDCGEDASPECGQTPDQPMSPDVRPGYCRRVNNVETFETGNSYRIIFRRERRTNLGGRLLILSLEFGHDAEDRPPLKSIRSEVVEREKRVNNFETTIREWKATSPDVFMSAYVSQSVRREVDAPKCESQSRTTSSSVNCPLSKPVNADGVIAIIKLDPDATFRGLSNILPEEFLGSAADGTW